jgi:hypothetical protein
MPDYRYWLRRLLLWLIQDGDGGGMVEKELGECGSGGCRVAGGGWLVASGWWI